MTGDPTADFLQNLPEFFQQPNRAAGKGSDDRGAFFDRIHRPSVYLRRFGSDQRMTSRNDVIRTQVQPVSLHTR